MASSEADGSRHPAAASWQLPPRDRPPLPGGLRRTNLRELLARPGRFEHHLMVVARAGVGQLEAVTAGEPVYFAHCNISDELALALPSGDPMLDALPLRTFLTDPGTFADVGRLNHRAHDLVLHPHGMLHWPGRLRPPFDPPRFAPGARRTLISLVYCASRPTPPVEGAPGVSPGREADAKAHDGRKVRFGLRDIMRDPAGPLAAVGDTTLELLVAPREIAPPLGGYVVVLEAAPTGDFFPGDLVYVPAGELLVAGGIARALLFSSAIASPDPPPESWASIPTAPFPALEKAPRGSLPVEVGSLRVREISPSVAGVSVDGRSAAEVPRYWLARMLFCIARHDYQLGYAETYGGFFYDDADGRYRLGVRGAGAVELDRPAMAAAAERLYRAVAPEGYEEP